MSRIVEWILKILTDDSEIDETQEKIDAQVAQWKAERAIIMSQMQEINRGVGLIVQGIRTAARATGQSLGPMENALLGLITSTSNMIVSTAVALATGSMGILTGVAIGLASFAYGMQLANTAKIITDFAKLRESMREVTTKLAGIDIARQQGMIGVG